MAFRFTALMALIFMISSACGTVKRGTIPWEQKEPEVAETPRPERAASVSVMKRENPELAEVKSSLQRAYNDWQGVPYVLGGSGYDGVDCSSFMQIVFLDYFGMELPRNTRDQFGVGKKISKESLSTGDLIFFKTGRKSFHVGVMMNDEEFLHASTSSGVMISALNNRYWQEVYYTARRIL